MKAEQIRSRISARIVTAIACAVLTLPGNVDLWAMQQQQTQPAQQQTQPQKQQPTGSSTPAAKISNEQLDSLVAPIALYPDPLLGQMLVASTYPLEIVQLHQWLEQNKTVKDKALADAVMKKGWDPSVQAMAVFPDVVKQMATNIAWTDDLGNAFLAQQNDVMDAVQRMRTKAVEKGALTTTEKQKVETKVVEQKTVVVVQPAKTEVVYVPSYDPVAIWGTPYYPYPAYAYPAYPAGGMLLGFGVGLAVGAAWGGGWGWNTGWGGNNVYVNRNNTFVNNYSRVNGGRYGGANGQWQHNAAHRGGAPYANQSVANRYNGSARGSTMSQRQTAARQNTGQYSGSQFRSGDSAGAQNVNRGAAGGGAQNVNRGAAGGGDRIGNRQVSNTSRSSGNSAFSGGSSGSAARASSARGASSMGGGMRSGGMRGGGRRR
ncbi:MAG TPA: DUF3300 domain-containing protein [Candidatus Binatia bacterium]|nr:DUF3300 domain-containing protein [Candidatus Binatia bacterium]